MLEVRYKLLDGLHHLSLGEVLLLEDALQLLEVNIWSSPNFAAIADSCFLQKD